MRSYDFVIAGGGLAGLSLACQLLRSPLRGWSMLIVDRKPPHCNRRAWSYWTDQPTVFDPVVYHRWSRLQVASRALSKQINLPGYCYEMVRGDDLERFARRELEVQSGITFQQGEVQQILDGCRAAQVIVDGQPVEARWVFDSAHRLSGQQGKQHGRRLSMHFRGWTLETAVEAFDPRAATFLDFRTPQDRATRFFYVLPFTKCRALIQYVLFAPTRPEQGEAEAALRAYLDRAFGVSEYEVLEKEAGSLAVTSAHRPRRLGPHVMAIGAKAGLVKPTTGFGFRRIQQDSADIVRSLASTATPWAVPTVSERHRRYDALLLDVLTRRSNEVESIFGDLFARNPIDRVLRFLDEATSPWEDIALISTLPAGPFLQAASQSMIFGMEAV